MSNITTKYNIYSICVINKQRIKETNPNGKYIIYAFNLILTNTKNRKDKCHCLIFSEGHRALIYEEIKQIIEKRSNYILRNNLMYIRPKQLAFQGRIIKHQI